MVMVDEFRLNFVVDDNGSVVIENVGRLLRRTSEEATRLGRENARAADYSEEAYRGLGETVEDTRSALLKQRDALVSAAKATGDAAEKAALFRQRWKLDGLILDANRVERKIGDISRAASSAEKFRIIDKVAADDLAKFKAELESVISASKRQVAESGGSAAAMRDAYAGAGKRLQDLGEGIRETVRLLEVSRDTSRELGAKEIQGISKRIEKLKELNSLVGKSADSMEESRKEAAAQSIAERNVSQQTSRVRRQTEAWKEQIQELRILSSVGLLAGEKIALGQRQAHGPTERTANLLDEEKAAVDAAIKSAEELRVARRSGAAVDRKSLPSVTIDPARDDGIEKLVKNQVELEGATRGAAGALNKLRDEFSSLFETESEISRRTQDIQNGIQSAIYDYKDKTEAIKKSIYQVEILNRKEDILANGGRERLTLIEGISEQKVRSSQIAIEQIGKEIGQLEGLKDELIRTAQASERYAQSQDRASKISAFSEKSQKQLRAESVGMDALQDEVRQLGRVAAESGDIQISKYRQVKGVLEEVVAVNQKRAEFARQAATKTRGITPEEAKSVNSLADGFDKAAARGRSLNLALGQVLQTAYKTASEIRTKGRLDQLFAGSEKSFNILQSQFKNVTAGVDNLKTALKTGADIDESFVAKLSSRSRALPQAAALAAGSIIRMRNEAARLGGDTSGMDKILTKITGIATGSIKAGEQIVELGASLRIASMEKAVGQGTDAAVQSVTQSIAGAKSSVSSLREEFRSSGMVSDQVLDKAAAKTRLAKAAVDAAEKEVTQLGLSFAGASPKIDQALQGAIGKLQKAREEEAKVNAEFQKTSQAVQVVRNLDKALVGVRAKQSSLGKASGEVTKKVKEFGTTWKTVGPLATVQAVRLERENRTLNLTIRSQIENLKKMAQQAAGTSRAASFQEAIKSLQKYEKETVDAGKALEKLGTPLQKFVRKFDESFGNYDRVLATLSRGALRFAASLAKAPVNMVNRNVSALGGIIRKAFGGGGGGGGPLGPFINGLSFAGRQVTKLGARIRSTITTSRSGFGGLGSQLFSIRGLVASLFVGFGIRQVVNDFALFRGQINAVQAAAGATREEIVALEDANFNLAQATRFTTQDVAGAQRFFAQQGLNVSQITKIQGEAARFAEATNLKFAKAADIALKTTNQFRLGLDELSRVQDVLVATTNNSAAQIEGVAQALKNVGPVAAGFGISLEETSAALAVLAKNGIRAGRAGTVLRTGLARLQKPSRESVEVLGKLGRRIGKDFRRELYDTDGTLVSISKSFQFLEESAATPRDLVAIFGQEAQRAGSALLGSSRAVTKFAENLKASGGTTRKASDILRQGLAQAQFELTSSFDVLFKTVVRSVEPALVSLFKVITEGVRSVRDMYKAFSESSLFAEILTFARDSSEAIIRFVTSDFGPFLVRTLNSVGRSAGGALADGVSMFFNSISQFYGKIFEFFGFPALREGLDSISKKAKEFADIIRTGTIPNLEDLLKSFREDAGAFVFFEKIKIVAMQIGVLFQTMRWSFLKAADTIIRKAAGLSADLLDNMANLRNNVINILEGIAYGASFIFEKMLERLKMTIGEIAPAIRNSLSDTLIGIVKDLPNPTSNLGKALYGLLPGFSALQAARDSIEGLAASIRPATTEADRFRSIQGETAANLKKALSQIRAFSKEHRSVNKEAIIARDNYKLIAENGLPAIVEGIERAAAAEAEAANQTQKQIDKTKELIARSKELANARGMVRTGPVQDDIPLPNEFQLDEPSKIRTPMEPDPGFRESFFGAFEGSGQDGAQQALQIAEQGKQFRVQQLEEIGRYKALEAELEISREAEKQENLRLLREGGLQAYRKGSEKLTKITEEQAERQAKLEDSKRKVTLSASKQLFSGLIRLAGSENEKVFKITKAFAIADATIQAFRAANRALAELPPPANVIAAAAALANGMANVKAIKSQQPGGGGGGLGGGASHSQPTPVIPQQPSIPEVTDEEGEALSGRRDLQVIIQGNVFGDEEFVRDRLAPVIRESLDDNEDFGLRVDVTRA